MEYKHETNKIGTQRYTTTLKSGIQIDIYKWSERSEKWDWGVHKPKKHARGTHIASGYADTLEKAKELAEQVAKEAAEKEPT